jgi:hypothetical protein
MPAMSLNDGRVIRYSWGNLFRCPLELHAGLEPAATSGWKTFSTAC